MQRRYKVLLSAYACEPNKGSEPGVGWNWALEIEKRGHEVFVVTRKNNRGVIDEFFLKEKKPDDLHFIYYDLPTVFIKLKKIIGVNCYYLLWQIGLSLFAKKLNNEKKFDLVHHISFGVFRHPSFLYNLKLPLFFGPVGGGEQSTSNIRKSFKFKYQVIELLRNIINKLSSINPFLIKLYRKAVFIYAKTSDTKFCIPSKYHYKTRTSIEIGINANQEANIKKKKNATTFLFAGRLVYWKGVEVMVKSFAKACKQSDENIELVIAGSGEDIELLKNNINEEGIQNRVKLLGHINQSELWSIYNDANVFLFPSFHDSSGNVILEALSCGLPVICLELGGPPEIVDNSCGHVISVSNKKISEIQNDLTKSILEISGNKNVLGDLSKGAVERASLYRWEKVVGNVYNEIESYMAEMSN